MKSITKYIRSWLGFYSNQKSDHEPNKLIINVDTNGKIFVNFDVKNFSQSDAENFGKMLYYMNEGFYVQTILDLFLHFTNKDYRYADFSGDTIRVWSQLVTELSNDNERNPIQNIDAQPIISPSNFYKMTGYTK